MSRSYTPEETLLHKFRTSRLYGDRISSHQYSTFQSMTMQVYPLKADMAALRRFIDSYLNFVEDPEQPPFYFKPAIPYVALQLVHYPRLASTGNLTSFKQHEITFSVLLECYQVEDGKLVFKQFAVCTPFIYLDQGASIVGGRSLFGWPKAALLFDDVHPPDVPTQDAQLVNLKLRVPSVKGDTYVPLIEAYRAPRPFTSMRRTPADSITAGSDALSAYFDAAAEEWYSILRFPSGGYEQARDIESIQTMAQMMGQQISALMPMFPLYRQAPESFTSTADVLLGPSYMDIITIKQVRDAEDPQLAAFQSVVRSTMYLDRFYDFGWLCSPMGPDPTSDIKIIIHNRPDQPIVESLGLEVSEQTGNADRKISILKPRFPYWFNADMVYGLGTNLYWRGAKTSWASDVFPKPDPFESDSNLRAQGPKLASGRFGSRYGTLGSGAQQENPLEVISPKGLVYVANLPLDEKGGKETLSTLVKSMLCNTKYDFDLYRRKENDPVYVWLMARHINDSGVGLSPAQAQEIVLGAFVEWREKGLPPPGLDEFRWVGFMPLFAITDSESRALTHSEVFGRPIVLGTFQYLGAKWPWPSVGARTDFDVVAASSSILPVLYSGASPEERELIRITATLKGSGPPGESPATATDEQSPYSWLERYGLSSWMSTAATTNKQIYYPGSLIIVSLAQVIDCRLPSYDSYQAIVMQVLKVPRTLFTLGGKAEKPYDLYVQFPRYESVPIVQTLGLKIKKTNPGADATIDIVKATNHGWFDALVEEKGSIDFASRLGASEWQYPEDKDKVLLAELKRIDYNIENELSALPVFLAIFDE